ncbi:MAG TPA: PQQ-binding-like beta-propeller repeat protein [Gemmataceae bacterium]|nr:PQQ-binding-like beta-propeller repeat protein [Gemmataceae bacterium]
MNRNTIARRGLAFCLLSSVFCLLPIANAGDWPQFRGPGGAGVSDDTGLPTTWDVKAGTNVRWQADLPARGVSCPVVAKGKVYVTCCGGYRQDRLHVLCFDAATGKRLWERQFTATGSTNSHPKTSMAGPTPVTDGERVFALFGTGDVAALDSDGNLLWYRALVRDYPTITNQVGMAASPVLWKDVLLLPLENAGDQSFALALDATTGKNRWKAERKRDINWVTPLLRPLGDGAEVLFQSSNELTAYDVLTGEKRWAYKAAGLGTVPMPVALDGLMLATGGESAALRLPSQNGEPEAVWTTNKLRSGYTTPTCYRKRVYAVNATFLNCVGAEDGKPAGAPIRLRGTFWASPVAGDGKIYVANEEGTVFVVKVGDKPELVATNPIGEEVIATPAIADGALFLRTKEHLYCIALKK